MGQSGGGQAAVGVLLVWGKGAVRERSGGGSPWVVRGLSGGGRGAVAERLWGGRGTVPDPVDYV